MYGQDKPGGELCGKVLRESTRDRLRPAEILSRCKQSAIVVHQMYAKPWGWSRKHGQETAPARKRKNPPIKHPSLSHNYLWGIKGEFYPGQRPCLHSKKNMLSLKSS